MAAHRSSVHQPRGFVVEVHGKMARKRSAANFRHPELVEEMVDEGRASLVDDPLSPKALLADDHVERGGIVGSIDIDEIEADLDPARFVEDADQVPRVLVVPGNMIGWVL